MTVYVLTHLEVVDTYKLFIDELMLGVFSSLKEVEKSLGINIKKFTQLCGPLEGTGGNILSYTYEETKDGRWLKRFDIEEIVVDTPHHLLIEEIVNKMNRQRGLPR